MDKKKYLSDENQGSTNHVQEERSSDEFTQNPDLQKKKEQELRDLKEQNLRFQKMMESLRSQGKLTPEEEERVFGVGGMLEENEERYEQQREEQFGQKSKDVEIPVQEEMPSGSQNSIKNDSQSDSQNGTQEGNKKTSKIRHFRGLGKVAAAVCIICGSIFAVSMTSEANRQYVMDTVSYYKDGNTNIHVKSDGGTKQKGLSANEVKEEILQSIMIEIPDMNSVPEGMEITNMELFDKDECATITYKYKNSKLLLYVSAIESVDKIETSVLDGTLVSEVMVDRNTIKVPIYEDEDSTKSEKIYSAEWYRKDCSYRFVGNVEKGIFEKILKNMTY